MTAPAFIEPFAAHLDLIVTGMFGGTAYMMFSRKQLTIGSFLRSVIMSAFTGFAGGLITLHFTESPVLSYGVAGLLGFGGGISLLMILEVLAQKTGIEMPESFGFLRDQLEKTDSQQTVNRLIKAGKLSAEDYYALVSGSDRSCLHSLLDNGDITAIEYQEIIYWLKKDDGNES